MKSKELFDYLFFGVLTTLVNYGTFVLSLWLLGDKLYLIANIISFFCATVFAYITNKIFVFQKLNFHVRVLIQEIFSFFSARLATFGMEELGLFVFVSQFGWGTKQIFHINGTIIIKIALSFIAVILNYAISKWLIFRDGDEK